MTVTTWRFEFATASTLEERGFEPPVPLAKRVGLSGGTGSVAEAKRAVSRASSILWGAEGSNPLPSAGEISLTNEFRGDKAETPPRQRRRSWVVS